MKTRESETRHNSGFRFPAQERPKHRNELAEEVSSSAVYRGIPQGIHVCPVLFVCNEIQSDYVLIFDRKYTSRKKYFVRAITLQCLGSFPVAQ